MNAEMGKYIIIAGALLLLAGIGIYFFHDKFHWLGRLPGDIRIERENFRFYFPLTTMIVFSVALSIVVQIVKRLL